MAPCTLGQNPFPSQVRRRPFVTSVQSTPSALLPLSESAVGTYCLCWRAMPLSFLLPFLSPSNCTTTLQSAAAEGSGGPGPDRAGPAACGPHEAGL